MNQANPRRLEAPDTPPCALARPQRGFTLIEALVSTAITTIAGTALLLGISSSLRTTDLVLEQTIAEGLAQQLLDEAAGLAYQEPGTITSPALGPDSGETSQISREAFDDLDDLHGLSMRPPRDYWGVELGLDNGDGATRHANFQVRQGYFADWRQQVDVYYVAEGNTSTPLPIGQTSEYRAMRVRIFLETPGQNPRPLADLTRVFAHVP